MHFKNQVQFKIPEATAGSRKQSGKTVNHSFQLLLCDLLTKINTLNPRGDCVSILFPLRTSELLFCHLGKCLLQILVMFSRTLAVLESQY